jgi:hypothetical protein
VPCPAGAEGGILRHLDFDCGAAFPSGRGHDLGDHGLGDLGGGVASGYYQHIHCAYEPADSHRRPQAQHRTAYYLTARLGDHHTGVRHVDQLAKQTDRVQWGRALRGDSRLNAHRVKPINIGYAGLSDQVVHSKARTSCRDGLRLDGCGVAPVSPRAARSRAFRPGAGPYWARQPCRVPGRRPRTMTGSPTATIRHPSPRMAAGRSARPGHQNRLRDSHISKTPLAKMTSPTAASQ